MRDIAIQRAGLEDSSGARKLVDELHKFLEKYQDEGVFLMHSRLDLNRLLETYGVSQ